MNIKANKNFGAKSRESKKCLEPNKSVQNRSKKVKMQQITTNITTVRRVIGSGAILYMLQCPPAADKPTIVFFGKPLQRL